MPEQQRFERGVPVAFKRFDQGVKSVFAFFVDLKLYEGHENILTLRLRNGVRRQDLAVGPQTGLQRFVGKALQRNVCG